MEETKFINHTKRALKSETIELAKKYALKCHREANHKYDKTKPYSVHLQIVFDYGKKYAWLLNTEQHAINALAACWTHDTIEDTRQTYNDVKKVLGIDIAEITFALTNEKGRTRHDRASAHYYMGIRQTTVASFVKMCDRLANVKYSKDTGGDMLEKYKSEQSNFKFQLYTPLLKEMWDELDELLK